MAEVIGRLISQLDHPTYISYDGESLVIPPRGIVKKVKQKLLGAIPKRVVFVKESK